ncbi:conserved hypothetical protein [Tenacibaculum litopenaei]|uniref:hypothetical protein n=1 Tax=Tenacibaculum litopenaei TaxID=396016 RepID=UPI0038937E55
MKPTTVYFLVALYLIAMLRPITPFVEYAINYDYIAKVLCINKDKPEMSCNGKCQLMKKLEKQQEDDYQALRVSMEEYPIGFVSIMSIESLLVSPRTVTIDDTYQDQYTYQYLQEVFHPPAV